MHKEEPGFIQEDKKERFLANDLDYGDNLSNPKCNCALKLLVRPLSVVNLMHLRDRMLPRKTDHNRLFFCVVSFMLNYHLIKIISTPITIIHVHIHVVTKERYEVS